MERPAITEEETLVEIGPYFLIQRKAGHCLTEDSVLLADFASATITEKDEIADLCSGTGAIALMLAWKTRASSLTAVEIDPLQAEAARTNAAANGLSGRLKIVNSDYRALPGLYGRGAFSAVVANPPYMKAGTGRVSPRAERALARSEAAGSLKELVETAAYLSGRLYIVLPFGRLVELEGLAAGCGLRIERHELVRSADGAPRIFLAELAAKGLEAS